MQIRFTEKKRKVSANCRLISQYNSSWQVIVAPKVGLSRWSCKQCTVDIGSCYCALVASLPWTTQLPLFLLVTKMEVCSIIIIKSVFLWWSVSGVFTFWLPCNIALIHQTLNTFLVVLILCASNLFPEVLIQNKQKFLRFKMHGLPIVFMHSVINWKDRLK